MKILVTGGAGFIASHIADAFVANNHQVTIVDDLSSGVAENINPLAKFVKMDIRHEDIKKLIIDEKFDVIDHHAAHIHVGRSVENPTNDADINIMGTLNILKAAKESGTVKHIIFASTGGAIYGDKPTPFNETMSPQPLSPYGISKRSVELYLYFYQRQYDIAYTTLRYANVYGPRQNPHGEAGVISIFFENLKQGKVPTINGDGTQTRDYVYVQDVVNANLKALEKRVNGEFNIGTGIETDVNQIYQFIKESTHSSIDAVHGSPRAGEQTTSSLDASLAAKTLNWQPQINLAEGIKLTADFFLQ